MKKDKKNKKPKKRFIEKQVRADNTTEYIIHDTPMSTWWGKTILVLILVGFIVIPVLVLIFALI